MVEVLRRMIGRVRPVSGVWLVVVVEMMNWGGMKGRERAGFVERVAEMIWMGAVVREHLGE